MSSNSPVLLLPPSAVPMGPVMAPLLIPKSDPSSRGLMSVAPSPKDKAKDVAAAVGRANLKLDYGFKDSAESKLMREASPVTPSPILSSSTSSSFAAAAGAASPGTVFSPRLPASKLASSAVLTSSPAKSANAAPIVTAPAPTAVSAPSVTATVTPVTLPVPQPPASVTKPASSAPAPAVASISTTHVSVSTPSPVAVRAAVASPSRVAALPSGVTTKRAAAVAAAAAAAAAPLTPVMAPASAPSSPMSSPSSSSTSGSPPSSPKSSSKSNTGRWTEAEHKLFLKGLEQFPYRAWKKIATLIKTRTVVQIRTHAQKYYQKLEKEEQRMREREAQLSSTTSQGLSSAVSTPRAETPSAPSTPSVAASLPEFSLAASAAAPSAAVVAAAASLSAGIVEEASAVLAAAVGKRKAPLRKRKSSSATDDDDDVQSSLPKRMMKEKKFVREKTMSPKQKTVVSNNRLFSFGDVSSSDDSTKGFGRGLNAFKTNPLDFDEEDSDVSSATGTSSMMLDFAEEKPTMVDYPFSLDTALDQGLTAMENDELLQLSDDESLEWFSSSTHADQDDDLVEPAEETEAAHSPVGSPLNLGRFSPLYSEDCLQFADPSSSAASSQCSTPSPILTSSADCSDFGLSGDEAEDDDDDFVLDPEKFLSSYFNPDADASGAAGEGESSS